MKACKLSLAVVGTKEDLISKYFKEGKKAQVGEFC